jgi:hypothetical protein
MAAFPKIKKTDKWRRKFIKEDILVVLGSLLIAIILYLWG